ncbi:MAG: transcriptional regulator [Myxococcales bacterium FL481]|nr:MAG: transcriptional regulator [Myxococcales bacterium FL481]
MGRTATVRASLQAALTTEPQTALELSAAVRIREKDVVEHLEHLAQSMRRGPHQLVVIPARCVECGFRFEQRRRLARPSRCPSCRSERISVPRFAVS